MGQFLQGDPDDTLFESPSKHKRAREAAIWHRNWGLVIVDEGHNMRGPRTNMSRVLVVLAQYSLFILMATATPLYQKILVSRELIV